MTVSELIDALVFLGENTTLGKPLIKEAVDTLMDQADDIAGLKDRLVDLQDKYDGLEDRLADLQDKYDGLKDKLSDLLTALD